MSFDDQFETKNVEHFKSRTDEIVWECACGNQRFYILRNRKLQCTQCNDLIPNLLVVDKDEE